MLSLTDDPHRQGTASVTLPRKTDKIKMPVGWTSVSDSLLSLYTYQLFSYVPSVHLQFIICSKDFATINLQWAFNGYIVASLKV